MKNIYILLFMILFIIFVILIKKMLVIDKSIKSLNPVITSIENNIEQANIKLERIRETKKSWAFFIGIYAIIAILKETLQNRKTEKTSVAFRKAYLHHQSQIKAIKLK